jgi:hypothetical protein
MLQVFLSRCCICCSGYTHMLQVYVSNVSPISNVCCKWHEKQAQAEVVLACMRRHADSSRHMRRMWSTRKSRACSWAHDNDRLQLSCFADHASLRLGPHASTSRSKIVSMRARVAGGACGSSMRIRQAGTGLRTSWR